jgi:hypothetical protein
MLEHDQCPLVFSDRGQLDRAAAFGQRTELDVELEPAPAW